MSCATTRVCILMMNSPNIPPYAHKATIINFLYASKYGYSFVVETCPAKEDMGTDWMWDGKNEYLFVWSKATMVKRHLPNYDFLLYLDSDAYVHNDAIRIEDFALRHADANAGILIGQDCQSTNKCFDANNLNTGVMLFRNTHTTFALLEEWMNAPKTKQCEKWRYEHPREQACLNDIMRARNDGFIKMVSVSEINGIDSSWIRHFMSTPQSTRNDTFRDIMNARMRNVIEAFGEHAEDTDNVSVRMWSIFGVAIATFLILFSLRIILTRT